MHIVIDARIINSSTGRYVERLLHYLQQVDTTNQYTVLVPSKDLTFWQPTNQNFTVKAADFANFSFAEQLGFKKFLTSLHADLVHFCMPQQPLLYHGKKVTTFHDLTQLKTYNSDKNWLSYHIKQFVARFAFWVAGRTNDAIIAPTDYTKNDLIETLGFKANKIIRTYEAADTITETALEPYNHPFERYILYVGQQSDYKNIQRLGDAHQKLLKKHPDLGLILVGKINKAIEKNQRYFEKNHYKNIHFTGFVSDQQRDWLYKNAQAYVFPSLMEGFGLPGLEAMGYGTPVISSNATCLPEVYGDAAHYFDPLSSDDMAQAIDDVLSDETLRSTLSKKGLQQITLYSWKRMAEQTHAIYMQVLDKS